MYKTLEQCLDICIEQGRDDFDVFSAHGLTGDEILLIASKGFAIVKITDYTDKEHCWYNYGYRLLKNSNI